VRPRPAGEARQFKLEVGEVHLIILLQTLADCTGKTVVYPGARTRTGETIRLSRAIPRPDRAAIAGILEESGYSLSEEPFRGQKVLWVTRALKPTKRRGEILRPGEKGPADREPSRVSRAVPESTAWSSPKLRLFKQSRGEGQSHILIFETSSQAEAESAYSLLASYLENLESRK